MSRPDQRLARRRLESAPQSFRTRKAAVRPGFGCKVSGFPEGPTLSLGLLVCARQDGEPAQAECISCFPSSLVFAPIYRMLMGETGMKSFRIAVGAAIALMVLLLGVVSAPATAFENPPPKKYEGYAWLDCRKGNGPEFKGPINGKGGGVCDQEPNRVIFIKGCGSESNPAKCPLVEVSQEGQAYLESAFFYPGRKSSNSRIGYKDFKNQD